MSTYPELGAEPVASILGGVVLPAILPTTFLGLLNIIPGVRELDILSFLAVEEERVPHPVLQVVTQTGLEHEQDNHGCELSQQDYDHGSQELK